jgi:hypothetical protein
MGEVNWGGIFEIEIPLYNSTLINRAIVYSLQSTRNIAKQNELIQSLVSIPHTRIPPDQHHPISKTLRRRYHNSVQAAGVALAGCQTQTGTDWTSSCAKTDSRPMIRRMAVTTRRSKKNKKEMIKLRGMESPSKSVCLA